MRGVIVFVKNPELGKVKTRLAATLGDEKAMEIYLKLLDYTRGQLIKLSNTQKVVFYSSFIDNDDEWNDHIFNKSVQSEGGLGDRMKSAFYATFDSCTPVIIIGSDCPQLTVDHIETAFDSLKHNDVVIGPSHDGGYYLLGMNKYIPELFDDIKWSTDSVFQETKQKAEDLKLKVYIIETLSDVDFEEDWLKYGF